MKSALVVGGSGFMGSHVVDALATAGHTVKIFDVHRSPYAPPGSEMIVGDILDLSALVDAAQGVDAVFNFAGIADIDEAANQPVNVARVNVLGAVNVMEAARIVGAKRLVFASSVYVYADQGSFYRASKQAAERFVETYQERYGLNYTILRYGSLYGPRADERNAIYRMVKRALIDNRIVFSGPQEAKREYIHVYDAARLTLRVLNDDFVNTHLVLTGRESMAVRDVMTMIAEMLPDEVQIEFDDKEATTHYVMTPYAFNPRVGHKLTSEQFVDLGQGLLQCIAEIYSELSDGNDDGRSYAGATY